MSEFEDYAEMMRQNGGVRFLKDMEEFSSYLVPLPEHDAMVRKCDLSETLTLIFRQTSVVEIVALVHPDESLGEDGFMVSALLSVPEDYVTDPRPSMELEPFVGYLFRGAEHERVVRDFVKKIADLMDFSV